MQTCADTTLHGAGSGAGAPLDERALPLGMTPVELAEVLGAFNDATSRLQVAHESLRAEVVRLQGELRAANEQIERSRRLAALGEMAAGIAHEVRNPLGSIRLYARMLVDDLKDRPGERTVAEKIASATRGLDAVVTDVLAFAREMRLNAQPVELDAVVVRAVEECLAVDREEVATFRVGGGGETAGAGAIRVTYAIGAGDCVAVCDAAILHRAIVNVVRNALQAMREKGADARDLRIGVERSVKPEPGGRSREYLALSVRDSGPGIPAHVMERMFNPFFTTRATGTGLGLAIVHRIMDAHGGRVEVRNVGEGGEAEGVGGGAVVELLLPIDADAGIQGKAPPRTTRHTPSTTHSSTCVREDA